MGANYLGYATPAVLAVDGNRNPQYSFTQSGSCAYVRADNWMNLYWEVDLASPYVIYNLTIYGTDGTTAIGGMRYMFGKSYILSN